MPLSRKVRALVLRGRRRGRSPAPPAKAGFRITALIVASALFMEQLDSTVLSTALPTMAHGFGVSPLHMSMALTAYLLGLAIFIPASGTLADRFGAKRIFRLAIVVFLTGSIFCGQAGSLPVLVTACFFQGVNGAMKMPVGRLLLLRSVDVSPASLAADPGRLRWLHPCCNTPIRRNVPAGIRHKDAEAV